METKEGSTWNVPSSKWIISSWEKKKREFCLDIKGQLIHKVPLIIMWCTQAKLSSEHITSQLNFNLNYQPCNCALKDRSGFQVWKCLKYHPQCQICALELKINQCWFHNANIIQVSCKKNSNFKQL